MKQKQLLKVFALSLTLTGLASCGTKTNPSSSPDGSSLISVGSSSIAESPYTLKITAIGSSTIKVSKTLQLRTSVTGTTQKDVTWTSLTPDLASVNAKGLVTALAAGTARIRATLNIDENCSRRWRNAART